ncbi:hypothetical protein LG293_16930 (plasmid) [Citricoccus nitrophenolicus]
MLWRKRVHADTVEQLHAEAERHFKPGTRYSVFIIRDETVTGTRISYRAEVRTQGNSTTPVDQHGPIASPTGRSTSRKGPVQATNPEKINEIPTWQPRVIPESVLHEAPARGTVVSLLIGGGTVPGQLPETDWQDHLYTRIGGLDAERATVGQARPMKLVIAGLLDDSMHAARTLGHDQVATAGTLTGGDPGCPVICFGLGDGSGVSTLAQGIAGMAMHAPIRLLLAVDPSRRAADTHRWVRQIAAIHEPEGIIPVHRAVTSAGNTLHELGYPVLG